MDRDRQLLADAFRSPAAGLFRLERRLRVVVGSSPLAHLARDLPFAIGRHPVVGRLHQHQVTRRRWSTTIDGPQISASRRPRTSCPVPSGSRCGPISRSLLLRCRGNARTSTRRPLRRRWGLLRSRVGSERACCSRGSIGHCTSLRQRLSQRRFSPGNVPHTSGASKRRTHRA